MRSPRRVSVESMKQCFMESSWSPLYFRQSLWTPHGVYGDYWELVGNAVWSPHRLYMESIWSLHGLHGNVWVSVKYSHLHSAFARFTVSFPSALLCIPGDIKKTH